MDILFEFIFEIIGEIATEVINNKKISLWLRIPFLILFSMMVIGLIALFTYLGISLIKETILGSIILLLFAGLFLILYIVFGYKLFKK